MNNTVPGLSSKTDKILDNILNNIANLSGKNLGKILDTVQTLSSDDKMIDKMKENILGNILLGENIIIDGKDTKLSIGKFTESSNNINIGDNDHKECNKDSVLCLDNNLFNYNKNIGILAQYNKRIINSDSFPVTLNSGKFNSSDDIIKETSCVLYDEKMIADPYAFYTLYD